MALSLVLYWVNTSLSMLLYYNECIMRLKLYWKSNLPFWALLVLGFLSFFFFFAASSLKFWKCLGCVHLFATSWDCARSGSSVCWILWKNTEGVVILSRDSSQTRIQTLGSAQNSLLPELPEAPQTRKSWNQKSNWFHGREGRGAWF